MNPYRAIRTGLRILVFVVLAILFLLGAASLVAESFNADYWVTVGWILMAIGACAVGIGVLAFVWALLEEGWKWLGRKADEHDRMY